MIKLGKSLSQLANPMVEKFSVTKEVHVWKTLEYPRVREKSYCAACDRERNWVVPDEAMAMAGVSLREIFRSIESHDLHFAETAEGFLMVCVTSLFHRFRGHHGVSNIDLTVF